MHLSPTLDQIGPLARDVTDCAVVLSAMMPERAWRRFCALPATEAVQLPLSSPRVGIDPAIWQAAGVTPEVLSTVMTALGELERDGVEVVEVSCPALAASLPLTVVISMAEATAAHGVALREHAADLDPGTRVMLELGLLTSPADRQLALAEARRLRHEVVGLLRDDGLTALASPTLPAVAPLLDVFSTDLTREAGADDLTGALHLLAGANVFGLPGLSLPCGEVAGSPVGLHLLGAPYGDVTLLRLGHQLEQLRPATGCTQPRSLGAARS